MGLQKMKPFHSQAEESIRSLLSSQIMNHAFADIAGTLENTKEFLMSQKDKAKELIEFAVDVLYKRYESHRGHKTRSSCRVK